MINSRPPNAERILSIMTKKDLKTYEAFAKYADDVVNEYAELFNTMGSDWQSIMLAKHWQVLFPTRIGLKEDDND